MYRLRQSNSTATLRFGRLSVSMGCSVAPDLLMSRFAARYGRFHLRHTMITSRAPSSEPAFQDKHTSSCPENCSKLFARRSGHHFPTAPIPNPLRLKWKCSSALGRSDVVTAAIGPSRRSLRRRTMSEIGVCVQPVSATPLAVYRPAFGSPRSFADVD